MASPTTRRRALERPVLEQAARILRVLAHPDRLRIVETLGRRRLSVGQLAATLDLSQAATSGHLGQMRAHGILDVQRQGRAAYYQVINPHALNVIDCIHRHGGGQT